MRNVLTALQVLDGVAQQQPVGLSVLARKLDIPKTTVQRCLATLAEAGWVEQAPGSDRTKWAISSRAFIVAFAAASRMDMPEVGMPHLHALAKESRSGARLSIRDGDEIATVGHVGGSAGFSAPGYRELLHVGVDGAVILAYAPPEESARYFQRHLAPESVRGQRAQLRRDHAGIRARGFATRSDGARGSTTIAAAIRVGPGWPVGSISITTGEAALASGTRDRFGVMVARAAGDIASDLAKRTAGV